MHTVSTQPASRAFSLIELSIVLVILGLLTGGILAGKSLIRASEMRSITAQHSQFLTATQAFRDRYFGLPGDLNNATRFWGQQALPTACGTPSTDALTCDGDGDGRLEYSTAPTVQETFRFWQQLANAGLVAGQYTGYADSSSATLGIAAPSNAPSGRLPATLWSVGYVESAFTNVPTYYFKLEYGNAFFFGVQQ
jgi:prepilin-type N-terminal cleavage/methylation domain-containing protein